MPHRFSLRASARTLRRETASLGFLRSEMQDQRRARRRHNRVEEQEQDRCPNGVSDSLAWTGPVVNIFGREGVWTFTPEGSAAALLRGPSRITQKRAGSVRVRTVGPVEHMDVIERQAEQRPRRAA